MRRLLGFAALVVGILLVGCADKESPTVETTTTESVAKKGKHEGWWCVEHGIPEAECLMCKDNAEAELKKKGDWCEKHEVAKSQCFACDPKLRERYAAAYRAKYGKEPPEPKENPAKD